MAEHQPAAARDGPGTGAGARRSVPDGRGGVISGSGEHRSRAHVARARGSSAANGARGGEHGAGFVECLYGDVTGSVRRDLGLEARTWDGRDGCERVR
jgi:hypothetical protein